MRIEEIVLSWFRGAGEQAVLRTGNKSTVVYGANASGKSTFPDSVEYVVGEGRISHLAHEYSRRRHELGVRNTHAPEGTPGIVTIRFDGGAWVEGRIGTDGSCSMRADSDTTLSAVTNWEVSRLILRQDGLADFIHKTKGEKYSALLPLLGLEGLEQAAENLHQLGDYVRERGDLTKAEWRLAELQRKAREILPDLAEKAVIQHLRRVGERYAEGPLPEDLPGLVKALEKLIADKIQSAQPENALYFLLKQIDSERLDDKLRAVTEAQKAAEAQVDTLLDRRIAVLEQAKRFLECIADDVPEVQCPACGRAIGVAEFSSHVETELHDLTDLRAARSAALKERDNLAGSLAKILRLFDEEATSGWLSRRAQKECAEAIGRLRSVKLPPPQEGWSVDEWNILKKDIPVVCSSVRGGIKTAPPSTVTLFEDKGTVDAAASVQDIRSLEAHCAGVRNLAAGLEGSEEAVRSAIKTRTRRILGQISSEVQRLWFKLHPDEPIEDVHLYIPHDADKAIDVGLKFYGKEQPSPRLTLSEGHRNSLGLCIFLALARLDVAGREAIVLDDVVSSFDREHRGMVVGVLLEDFRDRQVLLLTHDREWFSELRLRLPSAEWQFLRLRPWEDPETGLRWSESGDTLHDARELVAQNPEAAGNRVRATMDSELAIVADGLGVLVRYARGDRNDRRTCIELLERIISEAAQRLTRQEGGSSSKYPEAIQDWREAHRLLIAWANRASHAGTMVRSEVEQLIPACESALQRFRCSECHDPIWISDQSNRERVQCSCGKVRWKYG